MIHDSWQKRCPKAAGGAVERRQRYGRGRRDERIFRFSVLGFRCARFAERAPGSGGGGWRAGELGSWKLEIGNWKLETGNWSHTQLDGMDTLSPQLTTPFPTSSIFTKHPSHTETPETEKKHSC